MVITETELKQIFDSRMNEAGLAPVIDYETSQFLNTLEGAFAEIVLTDASRQSEAVSILTKISDELRAAGISLDGIVRSHWQIREIRYVGPTRTPEGGLRTAVTFGAQLLSGSRRHEVLVHVTIAALSVLRQKLGKDQFVMYIGWSPAKGDVGEENIAAAIKSYVGILLERGGMSYWDPLTNSELELNESAMSFVLGHSPAFQELHAAITDAFSDTLIRNFLRSLQVSDGILSRFDTVLPELSNLLGGAFRSNQRLSISANELFESLNAGERELIRQYVSLSVDRVKSEHPELVNEFPAVFK